MSDIPTVTYYAYSGTRYIGQYSGEDSAVLAFIAGKGYTTGPKPLASDRDLWVSIIGDATGAAANAAASAAEAEESASAASDSEVAAAASEAAVDTAISDAIGVTVQGYSAVLDATTASFTTALKGKLDGIEASADVTDTANVTAAGALMDSEITNLADVKSFDPADYATAAQGGLADTATQPGDLATVATSGDYDDLSNKPTLGTAAASDTGDFATAAQGAEADSAVQPGDIATVATTGAYSDLSGKPTLGTAAASATGDFATAAQGTKADNAMPKAGGIFTGSITLKGAKETTTSGSADFNLSVTNGTRHTLTLTSETDLTDGLADGESCSLRVLGGDSEILNYVVGTLWVGGPPTLTGDDRLTFEKWGSDLIGYAGVGIV